MSDSPRITGYALTGETMGGDGALASRKSTQAAIDALHEMIVGAACCLTDEREENDMQLDDVKTRLAELERFNEVLVRQSVLRARQGHHSDCSESIREAADSTAAKPTPDDARTE
jgi:hypothetical protein